MMVEDDASDLKAKPDPDTAPEPFAATTNTTAFFAVAKTCARPS
jgi:hypothetical protein